MKSKLLATLLIPLIALSLNGCCTCLKHGTDLRSIYAPPSIVLEKDRPVQTRDGVYRPTETEIWHSHKEYAERQDELLDALHALSVERNRIR